MNPQLFVEVDPRNLHLPTTRLSGADPYKLHRQIARFGASIAGMPSPEVYRGSDGELLLYNGVTRATRAAKLLPGGLHCGNRGRPLEAGGSSANHWEYVAMTGSRQELIRLIEQLSEADPELRLGQMLTNLATLARGPQPESVWDCEDDELVAAAQRLLTRIQERHAAVA